MVQVRQQALVDAHGEINFEQWLGQLPLILEDADRQSLLDACLLTQSAQQQPAEDTADWARDPNCLVAGLDIARLLAVEPGLE